MDLLTWVLVIIGTLLAAGFNYILNLAPGSDPEDFQVGPRELNITCDCQINILIIGGIMILALSAISGVFSTREELYLVGGVSFAVITIAGYIGRRKRHKEWKELQKAIRRSVPSSYVEYRRAPVDIMFEEDDEEEEDDDYGYGEP
ncbi:MAG: hypothetical protein ACFFF9_16025 [Candidatus Thorarchaeota archaeon]